MKCASSPHHDDGPSKVQYPVLQSETEPQVQVEVLLLLLLLWHILLHNTRNAVNTHLQ